MYFSFLTNLLLDFDFFFPSNAKQRTKKTRKNSFYLYDLEKDSSAASHIQPDSDGSFDELPTNEDPENELNDEDEESNNDNEVLFLQISTFLKGKLSIFLKSRQSHFFLLFERY